MDVLIYKNNANRYVKLFNLSLEWAEWSLTNAKGLYHKNRCGYKDTTRAMSYSRSALIAYVKGNTLTRQELIENIVFIQDKLTVTDPNDRRKQIPHKWNTLQHYVWSMYLMGKPSVRLVSKGCKGHEYLVSAFGQRKANSTHYNRQVLLHKRSNKVMNGKAIDYAVTKGRETRPFKTREECIKLTIS